MSPDISRLHSPPERLYNSAKYSAGEPKPCHPALSQLNKSSLRGSDATLTASADTLVPVSSIALNGDNESELEDSLEEKKDILAPLQSESSPGRFSSSQSQVYKW